MNIDVSRVPLRDTIEALNGLEDRVNGFKTYGRTTILVVQ